jgi:putative transposase
VQANGDKENKMPRSARAVRPGLPHHVTQRGNRRQVTFFCADDYRTYLRIMIGRCERHGLDIWAYCLMPNHVHLIAVPETEEALARAVGETHRIYATEINRRQGWQGHLWQARFSSTVMDEGYLLAAARYVERNPVRAELVAAPEKYPWSSARCHVEGTYDPLLSEPPLLDMVGDWRTFVGTDLGPQEPEALGAYLRGEQKRGRPRKGCTQKKGDRYLTP